MLEFTELYLESKKQTFKQNLFKPDKTKKKMMKPNFTVKEIRIQGSDRAKIKILHFDDTPVNCIYRSPVALPGTIQGTVQINVPVCGSNCPMFDFYPDRGLLHFKCTKSDVEAFMEEEDPKIKLI